MPAVCLIAGACQNVIKVNLLPHGGGGKGLINRFTFDKVEGDRVEATIELEQYGYGRGITDLHLHLTVPPVYQKGF